MEKLFLENSKRLFDNAKELLPGGITDFTKHPSRFIEGEYPIFVRSGRGVRITDVDNNEYLDFLCSSGPIVIGYRETEIDDAVVSQIKDRGFCFSLCQEKQNELAGKLKSLIPCAEKSLFVISGSDATTAAVRIARTHTGRQKIIKCGYHGWHDWSSNWKKGIPPSAYQEVGSFNFNDLASLRRALEAGEPVAAVIMPPVYAPMGDDRALAPEEGFLRDAQKIVGEHGAVLVFDEIKTGFRMDMGGAQSYYQVIPDMAVFGKAMANGYPISAVCGRADIMASASEINLTSTFFSNSIGMIAALKTIEILERERVSDYIQKLANKLLSGIREIIDKTSFPLELSGPPLLSKMHFVSPVDRKIQSRLFYTALIRQGILMAPSRHAFIAFRHTEEDIDRTLTAIRNAVEFVNSNMS